MSKTDYTFLENFKYKHDNPYHEKLEEFSKFTFRDEEAETFKGSWNKKIFNNSNPIHVEIGTGYGHFMRQFCEANPNINFVGMDLKFKRSFNLVQKLSRIAAQNFRYLRARGERISYMFAESEVDAIYFFFPDPWPKDRQKKKRLFQLLFLEKAYKVLKPKGKLYIKTDHDDYFDWMRDELKKSDSLFKVELESNNLYQEFPESFLSKYQTKFEKIFLKQQIPIKALVLAKNDE